MALAAAVIEEAARVNYTRCQERDWRNRGVVNDTSDALGYAMPTWADATAEKRAEWIEDAREQLVGGHAECAAR